MIETSSQHAVSNDLWRPLSDEVGGRVPACVPGEMNMQLSHTRGQKVNEGTNVRNGVNICIPHVS